MTASEGSRERRLRRYFGTDGVRGKVGHFPITPEMIVRLGWAAGRVLAKDGGTVLVGKDTRISGYLLESALEAGLSAAGIDVRLVGPMPTPAIAYLTRSIRADAGIVISASHNRYPDNGIKFFGADGNKLSDDLEQAIEAELAQACTVVSPERLGKAKRMVDAPRRYIEYCKGLFRGGPDLRGLHIVLDCANGATYHIGPRLFEELGARVTALGVSPDGLNINKGCGATEPELLQRKVRTTGANLGIAFDGDGDRLVMVDEHGEVMDGDELLYIIASTCRDRLNGAVVGTVMSNLGLEAALRELDLRLHRVQVGDRYIAEALLKHGLRLGGETSGHIICLDYTTTGDGIVTAMQVLQSMLGADRCLCDLKAGMNKLPQRIVNVRLEEGMDAMSLPAAVHRAVHSAENELGDEGRVLLRPSGTEPLLRILVEGQHAAQVQRLAGRLAEAVGDALHPS